MNRSFALANLIACIVAALLLLYLCIFPSMRVSALSVDISALCDRFTDSLLTGDTYDASLASKAIEERFDEDKFLLHIIFNHCDIDTAMTYAEAMRRYSDTDEIGLALAEAERLKSAVERLVEIETFAMTNFF